jgi:hypothetical protein
MAGQDWLFYGRNGTYETARIPKHHADAFGTFFIWDDFQIGRLKKCLLGEMLDAKSTASVGKPGNGCLKPPFE